MSNNLKCKTCSVIDSHGRTILGTKECLEIVKVVDQAGCRLQGSCYTLDHIRDIIAERNELKVFFDRIHAQPGIYHDLLAVAKMVIEYGKRNVDKGTLLQAAAKLVGEK